MSFVDELEKLGETEVRNRLVNSGFGSPGSPTESAVQAWLRGKETQRASRINIGSISGQQVQVGNQNTQNVVTISVQELVEKIARSSDPKAKSLLKSLLENSTAGGIIGAGVSGLLGLLLK
jgi:hypothetical protein